MTSKRVTTTALAAALLAASLSGGAAVAAAAPALAAPVATAATPTAVGDSRPITGSAATSRQVVAGWYRYFLDARFPIERYPGSSYWMQRLDSGADPASVLAELRTTREYAGTSVNAIYRAYLNRSPDLGANYWIDGVASGAFPLEWVEQNVAASDESLLRTGGLGDATVERWYSVALDRAPSAGEVDYWLGRFLSGSPLQVHRELWYTPEAVSKRVQSHYTQLLGRSAQPGEVAYWYGREVASDAGVIAQIASSAEYANRTR